MNNAFFRVAAATLLTGVTIVAGGLAGAAIPGLHTLGIDLGLAASAWVLSMLDRRAFKRGNRVSAGIHGTGFVLSTAFAAAGLAVTMADGGVSRIVTQLISLIGTSLAFGWYGNNARKQGRYGMMALAAFGAAAMPWLLGITNPTLSSFHQQWGDNNGAMGLLGVASSIYSGLVLSAAAISYLFRSENNGPR